MRTHVAAPEQFTLYVPDLDNYILIEHSADGVVIRTTRDNFSEKRKVFFIRRLAAEGFIPDRYEWFSDPEVEGFSGLKWIAPASSHESEVGFPSLRNLCTRRNAIYGCFFVLWLMCFVWAAHTLPGL